MTENGSTSEKGKSSFRSCRCPKMQMPSRENVYGVKMNSGISAKIVNEEKFSNWAWWLPLTPRLASTVFIQPGLHLSTFAIIAISNIIFFFVFRASRTYLQNTGISPTQAIIEFDRLLAIEISLSDSLAGAVSFIQSLLTWLLSGYLASIVNIYYRDARAKAGDIMKGLSSLVGVVSISINYEHPRAREVLLDLHRAISSMAHYALSHASSNTKFRKSKKEMQSIFDDRGLDGKYLLSFQKKETCTVLYLAILQTIQGEADKKMDQNGDGGCLVKSFDSIRFSGLRRDLELYFGALLSVISCMSSNKLPYSYHQLLHWGVRVFLVLFTVISYAALAKDFVSRGQTEYPFTCYTSSTRTVSTTCPTEGFIIFNVIRTLTAYFILACLEMYPFLVKTWEHSLVIKNYRLIVDMICLPLLPGGDEQNDQNRRGRQKTIRELHLTQRGNKESDTK